MYSALRVLLPESSKNAYSYDVLFFSMLALSAIVVLGVFAVGTIFCIRYRRSRTDVSRTPRVSRNPVLEFSWTLIPFALFLGIYFWGADLYGKLYTPPADAQEVHVVAKQWMWKLQHPNGKREINQLHIPVGKPVLLTMTSEDVIHSFFVPEFRIKRDVVPGRYTQIWFQPTATGVYHLECAEYCGTSHARMRGKIIVMQPDQYADWMRQGETRNTLAQRGRKRFHEFGCTGCHGPKATVHAPSLHNLYGKAVPLADGSVVTADDAYIRDSILLPRKQIAAGYPPIMPSFAGQISEQAIIELIAFLKAGGPTPEESQ